MRSTSRSAARLVAFPPLVALALAGATLVAGSRPAPMAGDSPTRVSDAVVPAFPCGLETRTFSTNPPPIGFGAGSAAHSIVVTGVGTSVWDVDLVTSIRHPNVGEVTIELTAPSGTTITISKKRGGLTDDAFDGTVWDDQAAEPVTDHAFATGVAATLAPEQALAPVPGDRPERDLDHPRHGRRRQRRVRLARFSLASDHGIAAQRGDHQLHGRGFAGRPCLDRERADGQPDPLHRQPIG